MKPKSNKIQIASFDDTTVVGINTTLVDYKLAWGINNKLALDLARYDDLVFEGAPFSFFYYTAGENYNVYNLVSLVCKEKVLFPFKPRLDYLFLIPHSKHPYRRAADEHHARLARDRRRRACLRLGKRQEPAYGTRDHCRL